MFFVLTSIRNKIKKLFILLLRILLLFSKVDVLASVRELHNPQVAHIIQLECRVRSPEFGAETINMPRYVISAPDCTGTRVKLVAMVTRVTRIPVDRMAMAEMANIRYFDGCGPKTFINSTYDISRCSLMSYGHLTYFNKLLYHDLKIIFKLLM